MQGGASVVRRGFTLIELLIVVVIIGILAAIAIPKFNSTKGKSYAAAMRSDLRNLASQQEQYFYFNERYTNDLSQLTFAASPEVRIDLAFADATGWSAIATHRLADPLTCAVFFGSAAPVGVAVTQGVVHCE